MYWLVEFAFYVDGLRSRYVLFSVTKDQDICVGWLVSRSASVLISLNTYPSLLFS